MKISDYKKAITDALTRLGRYDAAIDYQITALAGVMRSLDLANAVIDDLSSITVKETTKYGEREVLHPAFKAQKDSQDAVTRQMKALGLTLEDIGQSADSDPLIDMTKAVMTAGKGKVGKLKPKINPH